jgi:transcriptional regulator with XRE-family HTH domain
LKEENMAKRGDPRVLRHVVVSLRYLAGMTQTAFGEACGVDQASLSNYELGKSAPSEVVLRRMAEAARVRWPVVVHLRRAFAAILALAGRAGAQARPAAAALDAVAQEVLLAVAPLRIEWEGTPGEAPEPARRAARAIVTRLLPLAPARRRRLLELTAAASRSWAVAEGLCHESAHRAAHDAGEAHELAALALFVAERLPGSAGWKAVVLAYCWVFLGNALRVGNDFDGADAAFARSRPLWESGSAADRELFAAWRLPDLEASLRREQQRFPEALALLERARALAEPADQEVSRILLKREHVFERMGDLPAALATLEEAAPRIAAAGDPQLRFAHRFNTTDVLGQLKRYAEAEALLPEVRELAVRQGNGLNSIRVLWLEARLDTGRRRRDEAARKLEQVQREFTVRELPYDAALASLDLAVLWLEAGRTAEVRELAVGMAWIFEAQKIHREALAALGLFTEAARQEAATVELARRVIAELKRKGLASSSPGPKRRASLIGGS